jgi:hypothetical protein
VGRTSESRAESGLKYAFSASRKGIGMSDGQFVNIAEYYGDASIFTLEDYYELAQYFKKPHAKFEIRDGSIYEIFEDGRVEEVARAVTVSAPK